MWFLMSDEGYLLPDVHRLPRCRGGQEGQMSSNIDIGRAFGAPFKDSEWVKKTLLGGV